MVKGREKWTFVHLLLIQHMYVVELRIAIKASEHEDFSAYNRGRMSIAPARRRPTHVHRFPAHLSYIRADCATNPILRSSSTTDLETFEVRENQPRSRPSRPHFAFSEQGSSPSRAILGFGAPNVKGTTTPEDISCSAAREGRGRGSIALFV